MKDLKMILLYTTVCLTAIVWIPLTIIGIIINECIPKRAI